MIGANFRQLIMGLTFLSGACAGAAESVLAYIDPGSMGYLAQMLIGALVALITTMKIYWGRIREFFSKTSSGDSADDHSDNVGEE